MKKIRGSDKRDGWYEITPAEAARLLEERTDNRPIRPKIAGWYAEMMTGGDWIENGEPLILGSDGRLRDGQNRCRAAEIAGKPFRSYVVHLNGKVSDTVAFDSMNQGAIRSAGDRLSMLGYLHYNTVAALCKLLITYDESFSPKMHRRISSREVRLFAHRNKAAVVASVALSRSYMKKGIPMLLTGAVMAFIAYKTVAVDRAKGKEFTVKLLTGEDLTKRSPILQLRERLQYDVVSVKTKMTARGKLELTIKAWNLFREGKTVVKLQWDKKIQSLTGFDGKPRKM